MPLNQAGQNEPKRGDHIDQRAQDRFQSVHLVNVAQPDEPEAGQHQNADSGAEIAAVNGHRQLEQNWDPDREIMRTHGLAVGLPETAKDPLRQEENRRKKDQKWDQF